MMQFVLDASITVSWLLVDEYDPRAATAVTDRQPDLEVALNLASMHGLSFYDAMYLELAKRRDVTLATLDSALARAALNEGLAEPRY